MFLRCLRIVAHPPTYFFIMLHVVKLTHKNNKNPHCCSINLSHSPFSKSVLSPTHSCTVWQSIISPHLQKASLHRCMRVSRDLYLYLDFYPFSATGTVELSAQTFSSPLQSPRDKNRHICMWRAAWTCLMGSSFSSCVNSSSY